MYAVAPSEWRREPLCLARQEKTMREEKDDITKAVTRREMRFLFRASRRIEKKKSREHSAKAPPVKDLPKISNRKSQRASNTHKRQIYVLEPTAQNTHVGELQKNPSRMSHWTLGDWTLFVAGQPLMGPAPAAKNPLSPPPEKLTSEPCISFPLSCVEWCKACTYRRKPSRSYNYTLSSSGGAVKRSGDLLQAPIWVAFALN